MEQKINIVSENIRTLDLRAELTNMQTDVCVEQLCRMINDSEESVYDAWKRFNIALGKACIERKVAFCRKLWHPQAPEEGRGHHRRQCLRAQPED